MNKISLLILACFSICLSALGKQKELKQFYSAPKNEKFQVIGYLPGYRGADDIPDSKLKMMDIVCYSFATIDSTGHPRLANPDQLKALVKRCKKLGVKVMISFNGKHPLFVKHMANDSTRSQFVDEIWAIVKKYKLDGVDNDWEYPRSTDSSDQSNLLLMQDFSRLCRGGKKQYLLTMAVTVGKYEGSTTTGLKTEIFDLVDWLNIMVYGDFSEKIPLQRHSPYELLEISYNYWIGKRGLDPKKFVAGLPAYGLASGLPKKTSSTSYIEIIRQNGEQAKDFDEALVSNKVHTTPYPVYYNGMPTIEKKVRFAVEKGLGGVMYWQVRGDTNDHTSLIRLTNEVIGRKYN